MAKLTISIVASAASALAGPKPTTTRTFDDYVAVTEARIRQEVSSGSFLGIGRQRADIQERLMHGKIVIQRIPTEDHRRPIAAPGGLIHDWVASAFVPGATLDQTLALVQDYGRQQQTYSPDVQRSRLISRRGDDFHIFLRFRRTKVVTVVLNTEHDVHYTRVDATHAYSRSVSTRIAEVADPDTPTERELSPADDHGFLWRLNSYWRFEQADGGVYVECEAISLTRDIPPGLGWLIAPFVERVPRESLLFTMTATRKALAEKNPKANRQEQAGANAKDFDPDPS